MLDRQQRITQHLEIINNQIEALKQRAEEQERLWNTEVLPTSSSFNSVAIRLLILGILFASMAIIEGVG